ncbi:MAG: M1 family metallopeptidase [Flavobacteriales bacterium]|jgi:aminopeptidase N|nr:M1 family metallopeptidase [Flavobacteriales bacterium]MBT3964734.1 M1 family metallopeptidase [Flavobacteriales bacterium]MBT4704721.1 M1 family metallopeptidase [Flavobacteriales bacterium]MBT4931696.1 M1 family metallopeptidase [Flavobacteriales bacterium]MBT5133662.1 M1 family metallopeptidase [Flavobacteriales bacterium]
MTLGFQHTLDAQINMFWETPENEMEYRKFTRNDSLRGGYHDLRSNNDVTHYKLDLTINPASKSLSGNVKVYFRALKIIHQLQLDLYDNLKIESVRTPGRDVTLKREQHRLILNFEPRIKIGERIEVEIQYKGKPIVDENPPMNGGFIWQDDTLGKPFVGVSCGRKGASLWWPVKDHLYDEPDSVSMTVRIPPDLKCISNGKLRNHYIDDNNKQVYEWAHSYPINPYNVTLYVGDYVHIEDAYLSKSGNSIDLHYYVRPENQEAASKLFNAQVKKILGIFESRFGPYPWPKDGFKLVESPYEGVEHQTAIAFGDKFNRQSSTSFDEVLVRATAHEWWGNSVTAKDFGDIWIHEGFATYAEALVDEQIAGYESYLNFLYRKAFLITNWQPVIGPSEVKSWDSTQPDPQAKGALFLHTLRMKIGDDRLFFDILSSFYKKHAHGHATTHDFLEMVTNKTREPYTLLFQQYLYQRKPPVLEFQVVRGIEGEESYMLYRYSEIVDKLELPLKFKIGGTTVPINPRPEVQKVIIPDNGKIIRNSTVCYVSCVPSDNLLQLFEEQGNKE